MAWNSGKGLVELASRLGVLDSDLQGVAAPPTAWAAARMAPACMVRCHADQPVPAPEPEAPRRAVPDTATRSNVTRYWVSEEIDIRCSMLRPEASAGP